MTLIEGKITKEIGYDSDGDEYEFEKDRLYIDGKEISPARSQAVISHSPEGFAWGYLGSGPAQAALAILLEVLNDQKMALAYYQTFKANFVAVWPMGKPFKHEVDIFEFIEDQMKFEEMRYSNLKKVANG